jgi:hypothetical protein
MSLIAKPPLPNVTKNREYRPNLRVVRCCSNCKYFYSNRGVYRKGYCLINIEAPIINWKHARRHYPPTNACLICDNHTFRTSLQKLMSLYTEYMVEKVIPMFAELKAEEEDNA